MLRPSLAKKIISEVKKFLDENLIIVDVNGMIIASTDESRVGNFHEGAKICIQERRKIIITDKDEIHLDGVKAGINLPIFFQKQIVGVIGITGDPDKVSPYGELLRKMTELLINESYYFEQLEWQARALEAFVFDWIQPKEWSDSFINQAELLGIDLKLQRQVVIGHHSGGEIIQHPIWQDLIQTFMIKNKDVFVRWGNERFVIVYGLTGVKNKQQTLHFIQKIKHYIEEKYDQFISFGIGQVTNSRDIYQSFKEAERALTIAKQKHSIVFDEDLRLEMCLQDIKKQTRLEFIRRTIAAIIEENELMDTLRVFVAHNLSIKNTADALYIHINTLHYRLKRIAKITQLNPRDFHDMTTLYLALIFLDNYPKKSG